MTATITLGCGLAGLLSLPQGSVDLILTDPPSGMTHADFDVRPDLDLMREAFRWALKPDGAAVVMASHMRFAAALLDRNTDWYRYDLVWEKTMATGFLNAKKMPLRAHEHVLLFYRRLPCFSPQKTEGHRASGPRASGLSGQNYNPTQKGRSIWAPTDPCSRLPRSVIHCGSVKQSDHIHPQEKPVDLLRWLIRSYSRPGELVAEPFCGSASTGAAAITEGRAFVGFELREDFVEAGRARLEAAARAPAGVPRRTPRPRIAAERQLGLGL